jgi:drug/metabolite transporter superfamily protein YnfA
VGQIFGSVTLVIAAFFFLLSACAAAAAPERFAALLGLQTAGASGRNEVRAQYAGIFLMISLACIAALAGYAPRQAAFIVLIVALGGCTAGRLTSLIADRGFGGYNGVIRALFAVDTVGFVAASAGLLTTGAV